MERRIEIESCDLKFFLSNQNSDHAWIKRGGYRLLNVETVPGVGFSQSEQQIAWLTRTVEIEPAKVTVVE